MKIEQPKNAGFAPFKIVIETQAEAEHLMYKLCLSACPGDPMGIETKMRQLIRDELERQGVNFSMYAEREEKLRHDYEEECKPWKTAALDKPWAW